MSPERFYSLLRRWFPYWVRARLYVVAIALLGLGAVLGLVDGETSLALERLALAILLGGALAKTGPGSDEER